MVDKAAELAQALQSKEPYVPGWVMLVLLITFPPAAFFLMRQQKKYHHYFPILFIAIGVLIFLVFVAVLLLVPFLNNFFVNYGITPTNFPVPISIFAIVYGLVQFAFGVWGQVEMSNGGILSGSYLNLSLSLLVVDYCLVFILPVLIMISVIFPIYSSFARLQ